MHRTKRVPTPSGTYSSLLLLSSALSRPASSQFIFDGVFIPDVLGRRNVTRTYDPANPVETCHDSLSAADADGDGVVQNDEYVSFVADLSEGDFDVENYVDLPFVLKVNFVFLMCLCGTRPEHHAAGNGCCEGPEGGIYAPGAVPTGPGGIDLEWEEEYLNTVCEETQGAIELARDEMPTRSPVKEPTDLPSLSPFERPTQSPTVGPTDGPSMSPSKRPTALPSAGPTTSVPTAGPTAAPSTAEPTVGPGTRTPTLSPNAAPTTGVPTEVPKTSDPTVQPTLGSFPPSPGPSPQPSARGPVTGTGAPTVVPAPTSNAPTHVPSTLGANLSSVGPAFNPVSEAPTLVQASEAPVKEPTVPAPIIEPSTAPTNAPTPRGTQLPSVSSRPSRYRTVPPWYTPEPPSAAPPTPPASNTPEVQKPGSGGDREGVEGEAESLSAGQIAGICIASAVVAYAAVYIYAKRRKRENEDPELQDIPNKDLDDLEAGHATSSLPLDDDDAAGARMGGGDDGAGTAVVPPPNRGSEASDTAVYEGEPYDKAGYIPTSARAAGGNDPPRSPSPERLLITGVPPSPTGRAAAKGSDSSSAGESGWSSSAGMSSLNTASFDRTDEGLLPGSPGRLLAAIGAASAATATADSVQRDARPTFLTIEGSGSGDRSPASSTISGGDRNPVVIHSHASPSPSPRAGRVTREDLNAAIEAGDWAMVGATAALLADGASGSDLSLSESDAGIRSTESGVSSHSFASRESESYVSESSGSARARARELDRMVEKGDWEGVVLAAAQFEGSGRSNEEETEFSSTSGRTDSSEKMKEMRAEVERLVRRVVPDEIDNVDEMMLQFEGRTEELIETLRTMQERSVAQRARAAVQKTAKLEARARASTTSGDSGLAIPTQPHRRSLERSSSGSSSAELEFYGNDSSVSDYDYANASHRSTSSSVSDLGMTGSDTNTSSSRRSTQSSLELAIEKGDWRAVGEAAAMMGEGSATFLDDGDGSASHSSSSGPPESLGRRERAHYLDALIARGDWAGIVAAAGRYQAMDDSGLRGGPPTEEEREALAQADMWRTIADQSGKDAGDGSGAAAEAADWAISRSLERRMRGEGDGTGITAGDFSAKRAKVVDDESV